MKTKSANLLAKGYELIDGITVPVGTSNVDLGVEGKEPQNAEKLTIVVGNRKINMYVFRPSNYKEGEKSPLVYFIHGGGYHFGNVSMDEPKIQGIADGSGATVIAPDYTLSLDPSYKYPMELEQVYAGLLYAYEHADELKVDPDNIVIEGESAGGGLTARLALYNKDKGKVPLKGQVLIYPMLDYRTVLTDEEMIYFSPAVATVEQLKGLPETFMIVGSLDLFCDEDMTYAQKLMEAGIFTELYVEPGVPHAYEYLEWTPQAHRFFELRNHATARMLRAEKDVEESAEAKAFRELLLKYNMEQ